jgi:SAM-dependent methyltransferase
MAVQPANGGWARGSQRVGDVFLSWLAAAPGKRRLDVGCGNGAFTELLIQRCGAAEVQGVDPSEPQLAFAHARAGASGAAFLQGDALALPFDPDRFDAAVMALVIFFVPDPAAGVVEMARVVRRGGTVAAYIWDILADTSPTGRFQIALRAMGITMALPPSAEVSRMAALRDLWTASGLQSIATCEIEVERVFPDFEDFWQSTAGIPSVPPLWRIIVWQSRRIATGPPHGGTASQAELPHARGGRKSASDAAAIAASLPWINSR